MAARVDFLDQPINSDEEGGSTYLDLLPSESQGIEEALAQKQLRLQYHDKEQPFLYLLEKKSALRLTITNIYTAKIIIDFIALLQKPIEIFSY